MALNPRQRQFVAEYLIDFNGTKAAMRAGYSESCSQQIAFQLLSNPTIYSAVEEKIQEKLEVAELSVEWVLKQWKKIAEADPNELIYTRLECCRHCYGNDHQYQWTEPEYREACVQSNLHICGKRCKQPCGLIVPPPPGGGFGFDPRRPPLEECPQCHGEGIERVKIADTKHVTGSARRLYAGVKQTKDGIEIKMRDQDAALANISKYFGMIIDRREIGGVGGGPIAVANLTPQDLTDEQLDRMIDQLTNAE